MRISAPAILILLSGLVFASADKKLPIEKSSNELVEIEATLILDRDQIKQELGSDLNGQIVLVRVRVRPLTDQPYRIDLDSFMLLNGNDGQHSTPYSPGQIAGNGALVVGSQGTRGSMNGGRSTTWGLGGIGMGGGGMGNSGAGPSQAKITVEESDKKEDSPLLTALKEKVLPEKEITDPVSGLLYFQMEGKLKAKDIEFYYKTAAGKLALRFRP